MTHFSFGPTCTLTINGIVVADAVIFMYGKVLLVDDLMVKEEYRRLGYGSTLIEHLKTHCKKNDFTLGAYGIINTKRAKAFWAKHGVRDYYERLEKRS